MERTVARAEVPTVKVRSGRCTRRHRQVHQVAEPDHVLAPYDGDIESTNESMSRLFERNSTPSRHVTVTQTQLADHLNQKHESTRPIENRDSDALRQIINDELNGVIKMISYSCNDDTGYASQNSDMDQTRSEQQYTSSNGDEQYV